MRVARCVRGYPLEAQIYPTGRGRVRPRPPPPPPPQRGYSHAPPPAPRGGSLGVAGRRTVAIQFVSELRHLVRCVVSPPHEEDPLLRVYGVLILVGVLLRGLMRVLAGFDEGFGGVSRTGDALSRFFTCSTNSQYVAVTPSR
eukprot:7916634-Pyramimonas_sp.AAC.1